MYIFLSRIETAGELGSPGWSIMKILGSNSLSALLSGVGWVEFLFFLVWYRFTIDITLLLGKYFWTIYAVNPGNDWKYYFLIASVQFDWTGMKYSTWIYLTRSGKFVVCPILLDFFGRFTVEFLFSCLFVVMGEMPKSILMVSTYFHDTAYLTCYVDCLFIKDFFTSCIA